MTNIRPSLLAALVAAALPVGTTFAQQAPNAGQLLQQQQQQIPAAPRNAPELNLQAPATLAAAPGGAKVTLNSISIGGATVFSEAQLLAVLGDFAGKSYDLAGLRTLAERINTVYRAAGYPFARAFSLLLESADVLGAALAAADRHLPPRYAFAPAGTTVH